MSKEVDPDFLEFMATEYPGKPTYILKDGWFYNDRYSGRVFGNPNFEDSSYIVTSKVLDFLKMKYTVVETLNSYYILFDDKQEEHNHDD